MPVSDIMTTKLMTVSPEQTVGELQALFKQHKIHHLLVVESDQLLGIISDRDALKNLSPFVNTSVKNERDEFLLQRKTHQIMAKDVVTISPESGIRDACELLLDKGVSLLPVVDNNTLIGVVSWKDILRHFLK